MKSVDSMLDRKYDARNYNCAHFVAEAWEHITGNAMSDRLRGFLAPMAGRSAPLNLRREFKPLAKPESPCLVWLTGRNCPPHVGMYIRGKVLHIRKSGVIFEPLHLAVLGFRRVRFYR